jgi:site-specific DNA-cytosine methylase
MRVLVACEFSGIVREAFKKRGHDAWSCDFLPTEIPGQHIRGDVLEILNDGWDLIIAHPPCTYLCVAGLHYSKKDPERRAKTLLAYEFFMKLYNAPIEKACIENPVGYISTAFRKPDQIIDPFNFGVAERKKTCLWLRGLPPLIKKTNLKVEPNHIITRKTGKKSGGPYRYYWRQGKSAKDRSRTFGCIAKAMAEGWG